MLLRLLFLMTIMLSFQLHPANTLAYEVTEGNITAAVGPFFTRSDFTNVKSGALSPYKRGWGLLASADVGRASSLDFGLFYLNKTYLKDENAQFLAERTELIHIALGYRHWLTSFLSGGISLFSAYSVGDVFVEYSDFPPGQSISTSASDVTEYGLDFSAQLEVYEHENFGLILEGRFSRSLTPKENEKADHYGAFFGLRYLVQDRPHSRKQNL